MYLNGFNDDVFTFIFPPLLPSLFFLVMIVFKRKVFRNAYQISIILVAFGINLLLIHRFAFFLGLIRIEDGTDLATQASFALLHVLYYLVSVVVLLKVAFGAKNELYQNNLN